MPYCKNKLTFFQKRILSENLNLVYKLKDQFYNKTEPTGVVEVVLAPAGPWFIGTAEGVIEAFLADNHHLFLFLIYLILSQLRHNLAAHCRLKERHTDVTQRH